jgi:N-acyl homoserine lactone hydrolase
VRAKRHNFFRCLVCRARTLPALWSKRANFGDVDIAFELFQKQPPEGKENRFFDGRPAIQEFQFTKDPDAKLEGVIDVFGDGSLFAILTPGHTAGHVYLARTPTGPVLFTGDACHTRWGWEHGVEPGSFTFERESERKSLLQLKALSERHPKMIVTLGP